MVNDTSTLNGALTELGETMATNLITKGVTDATASDGLTTLANKILQVPSGTVTQTLILTSNKTILSYYDSETCTITATLTGGTVEGQTITFYANETSIGTATTDSNGVATKTYTSTGTGDVIFTATKDTLLSNELTIEDCLWYDSATTDRTNEYTKNCTFTHNSEGYYEIGATSDAQYLTHPLPSDINQGIVEADICVPTTANTQLRGIGLNNSSNQGRTAKISRIDNEIKTARHTTLTNSYESGVSRLTFDNDWFKYKILINNNSVKGIMYDTQNNMKSAVSYYDTYNYTNYNRFYILIGAWTSSMKIMIKNIKVKPL